MIYRLGEKRIEIRGIDYFIADNATIIGSVVIEDNANIWYNAVLRGDIGLITIGEGTNIQDGTVIHTDMDGSVTIGKGVTVGHMATLHNCVIGDNCLIGMGAVILSNARVGKNCIIGAGALVTEGREIPDNSLVLGSPGKIIRQISDKEISDLKATSMRYVENFKRYKKELMPE